MPGPSTTVVLLVAHGSRASTANAAHRDLCRSLATRTGRAVDPAFLELAEPDIPTAIDDAVARGAEVVDVLPYFLLQGNHTLHQIPALVDAGRRRHPGVAIRLAANFGDDPALREVLAAQIRHLGTTT